MAQKIELSVFSTIHELGRTETNNGNTGHSGATSMQRRLLRIGIITLGVLCIIQATLNISLRLVFYSKEDRDPFSFNSSIIADMCQIDQSQHNSTQLCSCCNNLLRRLLRQYQDLKTERDRLYNELIQIQETTRDDDSQDGSGFSGTYSDYR